MCLIGAEKKNIISLVYFPPNVGKNKATGNRVCFDTCLSVILGAKANVIIIFYKHK